MYYQSSRKHIATNTWAADWPRTAAWHEYFAMTLVSLPLSCLARRLQILLFRRIHAFSACLGADCQEDLGRLTLQINVSDVTWKWVLIRDSSIDIMTPYPYMLGTYIHIEWHLLNASFPTMILYNCTYIRLCPLAMWFTPWCGARAY